MTQGVSIIIPAHNAAATLGKCLEGLVRQTALYNEVIVVDDRSVDNTGNIACAYGARCVENTGPQGPAGARNYGAGVAAGDILVFIDSDCIPPENWLEGILEPFEDPGVGAVGGGYCSGVDDSFWQRFCHLELAWRRKDRSGDTCSLVSNNMACRRDMFWKHGGFPEQYPVCEDMYLSYKISQNSRMLWLDDNGVVHHFAPSLPRFLKHQIHFAVESLRFFGDNPEIMASKNHQGKRLHLAILTAGVCLWLGILTLVSPLFGAWTVCGLTALGCVAAGKFHCFLYRPFIQWLRHIDFTYRQKAYLCSLVRDAVCFHAVIPGSLRWLFSRRGTTAKGDGPNAYNE